jgi:DNA polymerase I
VLYTQFDIETSGLDVIKDEIVSYQLGCDFLDKHCSDYEIRLQRLLSELQNDLTEKIIHKVHFEYAWMLNKHGIRIKNYQDSMLAAFLTLTKVRVPKIDSSTGETYMISSVALKPLCQKLFGENVDEWEEFKEYGGISKITNHLYMGAPLKLKNGECIQSPKNPKESSLYGRFIHYAIKDNNLSKKLWNYCTSLPIWNTVKPVYETEMSLIPVICDIEKVGMGLDKNLIELRIEEVKEMIKLHEDRIKNLLGDSSINLRSPVVGDLLRSVCKVPLTKISKDGHYCSDSKNTLPKFANYPVVQELMLYRKLNWVLSNCLERWKKEGKTIHTHINEIGSVHGRISCDDPNLMNVPKRGVLSSVLALMDEDLKKSHSFMTDMRKCFIPRQGYTFYMFDWSQIELVVAAFYAKDEPFLEAMRKNEDVHLATASAALHIPISEVTEKQRSDFKENTYGILYGSGAKAIAERIVNTERISYQQAYEIAKQQYKNFFIAHPALKKINNDIRDLLLTDSQIKEEYEKSQKRQIQSGGKTWDFWNNRNLQHRGYVKNIFGRVWSPDTPNQHYKGLEALASGTATGDMLKISLIRIYQEILPGHKSRIVLPVHDEIIMEIFDGEEKELVPKIKNVMEDFPMITKYVPIRVDIDRSKKNWKEKDKVYDSKKLQWIAEEFK